MFKPSEPWPTIVTKDVNLQTGQSPKEVYNAWLADVTSSPRYCDTHLPTAMVLNVRHSRYRAGHNAFIPGWQPPPMPGQFTFRAEFFCPTCHVARAHCPPEFINTTFETFDVPAPEQTTVLAKARDFVTQVNAHGCGFALFVGPPGTGKTRLACNVIRELADPGSLYVRQGDLTCALRATYGHKTVSLDRADHSDEDEEEDPPTPLELIQNVRFLVLDEIACLPPANDERLFLDELLKHRYEHRKPTILISNVPLTGRPDYPGLKEYLGDALADRIREATGNGKFMVLFTGESYRRTTSQGYLSGLA